MSLARSVRAAARVVRRGGLVAYPTESCFGLGCDPGNRRAVARLLRLKRRPWQAGLILIGDAAHQFAGFGVVPEAILGSWPGPHTWLVGRGRRTSRAITGRHPKVALRVPDHRVARALAHAAGGPVVSTSANRRGERPTRSARDVYRRFGSGVDAVVPGRIGSRRMPSTITDAQSGARAR